LSILINALKEINEMSSYSKSKLAKKLNTSEEVTEHILVKLGKMGYIKEENINATKCDSCPKLNNGCLGVLSGNPINALTITEKGKKLIEFQGK
jgi:predicted transcriptional regulator